MIVVYYHLFMHDNNQYEHVQDRYQNVLFGTGLMNNKIMVYAASFCDDDDDDDDDLKDFADAACSVVS